MQSNLHIEVHGMQRIFIVEMSHVKILSCISFNKNPSLFVIAQNAVGLSTNNKFIYLGLYFQHRIFNHYRTPETPSFGHNDEN